MDMTVRDAREGSGASCVVEPSHPQGAKRVLWVSQHKPWAVQKRALQSIFGKDVELDPDPDPFADAKDIVERYRSGGYDDIVVVAPLTVVQKLVELGVKPISGEVDDQNRFIKFSRVTDVTVTREPPEDA